MKKVKTDYQRSRYYGEKSKHGMTSKAKKILSKPNNRLNISTNNVS